MEVSSAEHESVAGQPVSGSTRQIDLAILGPSSTTDRTALRPETPAVTSRPRGPVTTANVMQLLEWQRYRCALTGCQLTPNIASLDHIVPARCGGEHLVENTQVLHKGVNRAKATMTNDEFIERCCEVVEHTNHANTKEDIA